MSFSTSEPRTRASLSVNTTFVTRKAVIDPESLHPGRCARDLIMKGKHGYSIGPVRGLQNHFRNYEAQWRAWRCGRSAAGSSVISQRGNFAAQTLDLSFLPLQD